MRVDRTLLWGATIMDWIKQHTASVAAVCGAAAGSVLVYVYVVPAPAPAPVPPADSNVEAVKPATKGEEQPAVRDDIAKYPAKFVLTYLGQTNTHGTWSHAERTTIEEKINGRLTEICHTTERADGYCQIVAPRDPKQLGIGGLEPRVKFRLHERDHRYAVIETYYYGSIKGVTWPELASGVKIGDATIRAMSLE